MKIPFCRATLLLGLCACHSYAPAPVDLDAHLRDFVARLPDDAPPVAERVDLADGLDRGEGRLVAAVLHPDCRIARGEFAAALAARDHAGAWTDPELAVSFERILETVPHQWLAAASIGIGLPINGRLGAERTLAEGRLAAALTAVRLAEEQAVRRLDTAWLHWSAAELRCERLRDVAERLRELEAIAARLAEAGSATRLDARQFTLERLRRDGELARAEDLRAIAALELKAALGLHPDAAVDFTPDLSAAPALAAPALRREALADGPALAALRAAHTVAEHELALAIRKQLPDLVLAPGWAEEDGQPRATLGLSLPLPIFAGNDAAIAAARAQREVAAERWRAGLEQALQALAVAEQKHAAAERQQRFVTTELLPLAERQLADGRQLAELGTLDPFVLLDALLRVHEAHLLAVDGAEALAESAVALNTFAWQAPLAPVRAGETP